jgi:hypothetical protein
MAVSKRTLIERIDRFIGAMEKARRSPDGWEGACLQQALDDLAREDVLHAEAMMILAKTAPEHRMSDHPPDVAVSDSLPTLSELRAQLQSVKDSQLAA